MSSGVGHVEVITAVPEVGVVGVAIDTEVKVEVAEDTEVVGMGEVGKEVEMVVTAGTEVGVVVTEVGGVVAEVEGVVAASIAVGMVEGFGLSVVSAGAKSCSLKTPLLTGQAPVFLKPLMAVSIVAAFMKALP